MSDFPDAQELRLTQLCQCVFCAQFRLMEPTEMSEIEQQTSIIMEQAYYKDLLIDYQTEN